MNKLELMKTANEVRKGIVTAVHSAKAGHPGGSLSAADIFTYLYFQKSRKKQTVTDLSCRKDTQLRDCILYWRREDISRLKI